MHIADPGVSMNTPAAIRYRLRPARPEAHLFEVRCTLSDPDPAGQRFALPAWIPGSYLILDFARHVVSIRAKANGQSVQLRKIDKHTWQAPVLGKESTLTVICEIYAADPSVRGAHLDRTHAFINGTSVFLRPIGLEHRPCLVDIRRPRGKAFAAWRVATALSPAKDEQGAAPEHGFGVYRAADYDELIDHPCELGTFALAGFTACGVPHQVAISGRHDCDLGRLTTDLQRICEWQIRFFGEPAPMSHYIFLINAAGEGYGGLEHRRSTALLCARDDLPYPGMKGLPERYRNFLGLCSHEYFHTWNVKRIKPAAFAAYDLGVENYTTLLWAFEGFTSYYDDLALLRSGLIKPGEWLALLGKTMDKVLNLPGRHRQSLAESSFDAWTKFYRPDENTPNAVVSYYTKGALVALALDLTLRAGTDGRVTLDDLMRALWQRHGLSGQPVADDDIRRLAEQLSGLDLRGFFATAIDGTTDLPWRRLLKKFAVRMRRTASEPVPSLDGKLLDDGREVKLAAVYERGALQRAGLSAGDVLLAIDGLRVTPASIKRLLARRRAGEKIVVHAFRGDELRQFTVRLAPPARDTHQLRCQTRANALRQSWLGK